MTKYRPGQTRQRNTTRGLRAKAWWVLRKNHRMTLVDIQSTICNGTERSAKSNLCRWFVQLAKVGVVKATKIDDGIMTSNGSNLYSIIRDVGPLAPIVRKNGDVYDPNSKQLIPPLHKGGLGGL